MLNRELAGKRMELLKQIAPGLQRIAFLMNSTNPLDMRMLAEAQGSARTLGIKLAVFDARTASELDARLRTMSRNETAALLVSNDQLFLGNRAKITQTARKARLPAIFPFKEYHEDGALMSYGPSVTEGTRKAAAYVDKILKGAPPGDLPIEQISKSELVIDVKTAKALGITIPDSVLLRADEVIR